MTANPPGATLVEVSTSNTEYVTKGCHRLEVGHSTCGTKHGGQTYMIWSMLGYGVDPALRPCIMYVRAGTDASSVFSCMGFHGQMMLRNTAASICSRIVLRCVPPGVRLDVICVIDRPSRTDVGFCGGERCGDSQIRSASVELREQLLVA